MRSQLPNGSSVSEEWHADIKPDIAPEVSQEGLATHFMLDVGNVCVNGFSFPHSVSQLYFVCFCGGPFVACASLFQC